MSLIDRILANKYTDKKVFNVENKTQYLDNKKNLFNKETALEDTYINQTNGALVSYDGYYTSDYIPVKKGITYTINQARKFVMFDTDKNYLNGSDQSQSSPHTFTAEQDGYIRFSFYTNETMTINTAQMEIGDTATSYEPYGLMVDNLIFTQKQEKEIKNITENANVNVELLGNDITLTSMLDDTNEIKIQALKNAKRNNVFNFVETQLNGETVHSNTDDITPVRTFYTVGANHGYGVLRVPVNGQTTADLGSQWSDTSRTFTVIDVDSSFVYLLPEYSTTAEGSTTSDYPTPAADLTHVSGATNTGTLSIASYAIVQLEPSVKDVDTRVYVDGNELVGDATAKGKEVQVREAYGILDYKALVDWAQSNIGLSYRDNLSVIDAVLGMEITYSFGDKLKCIVNHSIKAYKTVSMEDSGFVQSSALSAAGTTLYEYLPNVVTKEGYDFKTPVDMTNYSSSIYFYVADFLDANIPPHRGVTWLRDSTTDEKKIGFTMGYIIDKTNSKHADRLNSVMYAWNVRDTKKNYPMAIEGETLQPGDYKNIAAYRNYLSPTIEPTNINMVELGNETYVYIDYHENVTFGNLPLPDHFGKTIEVLESNADFRVYNEVVNGKGIEFTVTNGYGYAVLKLN